MMHGNSPASNFSKYLYFIFIICIAYACYELFFIPQWSLEADEFVFARQLYYFTIYIPYRDFTPYHTVLGYYLFSIPMFLAKGLFAPLYYIKDEIVLINAISLAIIGYSASRFFGSKAVVLSLLAVLANQLFLVYSAELRMDALACWVCLFATLAVMRREMRLGGILIGIALLISQKTMWYLLAIDGALLVSMLTTASPWTRRSLGTFNLWALIVFAIYIVLCTLISSWQAVSYGVFYQSYLQYLQPYFPDGAAINYYQVVLNQGPLLFALWPLTYVTLYQLKYYPQLAAQRVFVLTFASIALLFFIGANLPLGFNFINTVPAFFLLYAEFFSWLLQCKNNPNPETNISPKFYGLFIFSLANAAVIVFLIQKLHFAFIYNVLAFFPLLLCLALNPVPSTRRYHSAAFNLLLIIFLFAGVIYPLYQSLQVNNIKRNDYQKIMIETAASLLDKYSDYVAGVPYIYNRPQVKGLENIDYVQAKYFREPAPELRPLLLSSKFEFPTQGDLLEYPFENSSVKILIRNDRFSNLPQNVLNYLMRHYAPLYGSIYIYAPFINAGTSNFVIKFSGNYRVIAREDSNIQINGANIAPFEIVHLNLGYHTSFANLSYGLMLTPDSPAKALDPKYARDHYQDMNNDILSK